MRYQKTFSGVGVKNDSYHDLCFIISLRFLTFLKKNGKLWELFVLRNSKTREIWPLLYVRLLHDKVSPHVSIMAA